MSWGIRGQNIARVALLRKKWQRNRRLLHACSGRKQNAKSLRKCALSNAFSCYLLFLQKLPALTAQPVCPRVYFGQLLTWNTQKRSLTSRTTVVVARVNKDRVRVLGRGVRFEKLTSFPHHPSKGGGLALLLLRIRGVEWKERRMLLLWKTLEPEPHANGKLATCWRLKTGTSLH